MSTGTLNWFVLPAFTIVSTPFCSTSTLPEVTVTESKGSPEFWKVVRNALYAVPRTPIVAFFAGVPQRPPTNQACGLGQTVTTPQLFGPHDVSSSKFNTPLSSM